MRVSVVISVFLITGGKKHRFALWGTQFSQMEIWVGLKVHQSELTAVPATSAGKSRCAGDKIICLHQLEIRDTHGAATQTKKWSRKFSILGAILTCCVAVLRQFSGEDLVFILPLHRMVYLSMDEQLWFFAKAQDITSNLDPAVLHSTRSSHHLKPSVHGVPGNRCK